MSATHPHFVPNGESRKDTAILLVGTADEKGIDQRDIASTHTGFYISDALADALGDEGVQRNTNPYTTIDGPLVDRRLDLHREETGLVGEVTNDIDGRVLKTVDGPMADRRLDIHREETGSTPGLAGYEPTDPDLDLGLDTEDDDLLADDEDDDTYDPSAIAGQNIKSVKAHVEANPEQAEDIREAEQEGQNRETLVSWLDTFIEERDSEDDSL